MLLFFVACAASPDNAPLLVDTVPYRDGEVLVSVAGDGVAQMGLEDDYGVAEVDRSDEIAVVRLGFDAERPVRDVLAELEGDPRVRFVEPNHLVRGYGLSSDAYVGYQWNLPAVGASEAWGHTTGKGVTVAVIDSGLRTGGPDGITHVGTGWDFYDQDADPKDGNGHGTFVAGTIGQTTNNGTGVAGLAHDATILPIRGLGDDGSGDMAAIANGLVWSVDSGAQVVNMSLGSAYASRTLESACDYAYAHGVTVVAASGNEYATQLSYPAAYESVIAVGAVGRGGNRAGYSNRGTGLDFVAPGGDLSKDEDGDGYADGILQETVEDGAWTYTFWEGTSMAAPHVAAAAALLVADGASGPDEVVELLAATAHDRGAAGYDTSYGYGAIDVGAALAARAGGVTAPDEPAPEEETSTVPTVDRTPPQIRDVSAVTQGRKFTVQWVSDEPATTWVDFTTYGAYGDDTLTTSHALSLTGSTGSTYYFTLRSTDASGNTAASTTYYIRL